MGVYQLLEHQMIILTMVFGILAAVCGFMAFRYGKQKSDAADYERLMADREKKWTDENKNVAAVRFQFHSQTKDLEFLYATLHITKIKGGVGFDIDAVNVLAKESELYMPVGVYKVEVTTREYKNKIIDVGISEQSIGQRLWFDATLEKKDPIQ